MPVVESVTYSSIEEHTIAMQAKLTGTFDNLIAKGKEVEVPVEPEKEK